MNIGLIGVGSMGGMLARALVRFGAVRPGQLWAANRSPARLEQLTAELPGITPAPAAEVTAACRVIFLCVKPAETAAALAEIQPHLTADHLLVTISNMVDIAELEERVPARVAKVIPSLAQHTGGGALLLMLGSRTRPGDQAFLERLLSPIGRTLLIKESQGRTCADLTSCGPAFIAYILRSMAHAAADTQPDLPAGTAEALVRETALATARLLVEGGMSFDDVIARISVPGGITAEGLRVLAARLPAAWAEVFATTHEMEESKKARVRV